MTDLDHAATFTDYNRRFAAVIAAGDPRAPVPTCPGWTLTQLGRHVGRGDRWAATMVRERATAPLDPKAVPGGKPADGRLVEWLGDGPRELFDAVAHTGAEVPVWTFTGPRPAGWWVRRRLHETVVHLADAALASGVPYEVEPEVAADALSEWLTLMAEIPQQRALPEATVHLHAHDEGLGAAGEWLITSGAGGLRWEHGHGKGDVALRGHSADLLLVALGRARADSVEVIGDRAVWDAFAAELAF
ncbi:maleylpyruvate isomerase family mycothiol-dependent enzyme [Actinokineospora spheciospongiae]|uniref:maleylpyruvate isomerase family mycothiol-dependent enzyme n=1 Tax=Actinokineospora spheciospongiae TaxID=909613 RepID=UPI000D712156|nr:maleylpyruvate isomerase family mycothiol-dependent enzyme [Actinokineospora spheciospongiae]PWW54840.1 uncharacterized protein (TIGR03083 family) [Actinokineospora spheciospongiae]